jgi:excisionase family DNA binding protein
MEPALIRVDEAARFLSIGRSTLYELIARGDIPTVHIGRSVRIPTQALKNLVETWAATTRA